MDEADQDPLQDDEPAEAHDDRRHLVGKHRTNADTEKGEEGEHEDHARRHSRNLMEEGGPRAALGHQNGTSPHEGDDQEDDC